MNEDFDSKGYLGEQIKILSKNLIEDLSPYFSFSFDLNEFIQKEKFTFHFEASKKDVTISTLLCRIIISYQAIIILSKYNLVSEAGVLLRSLIEGIFICIACCNDNTLIDNYLLSDQHERSRFLKKNHKFRSYFSSQQLNILEQKSPKSKKMTVENWAEKADLLDYYKTHYWFYSIDAHMGPKSTETHLTENNEGIFLELYKSAPERLKYILILAGDMIFKCLIGLYKYLKINQPDDLKNLMGRWKALVDKEIPPSYKNMK